MIPKTIHRMWIGGEEPDWTRQFANTWRHPGWELMEWDDSSIESLFPLVNQDLYDGAEEIAGDRCWQFRSDVVRYEILQRFGGVWVDADFECLKRIDPLIGDSECFAAWVTDEWINNAIMGAVPRHPFINRLVRELSVSVARGGPPNVVSGPQYMTRLWREAPKPEIDVLPKEHFYPYLWSELGRGTNHFDSFAIHHWGNKRREQNKPFVSGPRQRPWADFWKKYYAGLWEPETKAWIQKMLKPGDTFLDIGAWIGPVTMWALECEAKVIAVEPDPVACAELRRTMPPEVEIWEGALTPGGGRVFLDAKYELGDSMPRIGSQGVEVDSWTIQEVLKGRVPSVVKMDVEGYELRLLRTVAPFLGKYNVPMMVSLHDGLPDPQLFQGYRHVEFPDSARDRRGRSNVVVAC